MIFTEGKMERQTGQKLDVQKNILLHNYAILYEIVSTALVCSQYNKQRKVTLIR